MNIERRRATRAARYRMRRSRILPRGYHPRITHPWNYFVLLRLSNPRVTPSRARHTSVATRDLILQSEGFQKQAIWLQVLIIATILIVIINGTMHALRLFFIVIIIFVFIVFVIDRRRQIILAVTGMSSGVSSASGLTLPSKFSSAVSSSSSSSSPSSTASGSSCGPAIPGTVFISTKERFASSSSSSAAIMSSVRSPNPRRPLPVSSLRSPTVRHAANVLLVVLHGYLIRSVFLIGGGSRRGLGCREDPLHPVPLLRGFLLGFCHLLVHPVTDCLHAESLLLFLVHVRNLEKLVQRATCVHVRVRHGLTAVDVDGGSVLVRVCVYMRCPTFGDKISSSMET